MNNKYQFQDEENVQNIKIRFERTYQIIILLKTELGPA